MSPLSSFLLILPPLHSAPFFVTFWQLTLYDILYPKDRYDAEIARLKLIQREATLSQVLKPDERDRFIKQIVALASGLMTEATQHMAARSIVSRRLNREKAQWFAGSSPLSFPLFFSRD